MQNNIPPQPADSVRITLDLEVAEPRLDNALLKVIKHNKDKVYGEISRTALKKLFSDGKIQIKGQRAKPASSIAVGITYVDILGLKSKE
jgi:ribosomal 50S subunit-recycling heat shock protein